jgi:PKHD-type hydroxylase
MSSLVIKHPFAQWNNLFNTEELKCIDDYVVNNLTQDIAMIGSGDKLQVNEIIRKSKIYWIFPNNDTNWIFERMNSMGHKLNSHYFGFDIHPLSRLQYTIYEDDNGHYDWHWDCFFDSGLGNLDVSYQRKLSVVLLCQQATEGGNLELLWSKNTVTPELNCGQTVVFPSFMLHRVTPVTKGVRKTLVAWFEGPDWR